MTKEHSTESLLTGLSNEVLTRIALALESRGTETVEELHESIRDFPLDDDEIEIINDIIEKNRVKTKAKSVTTEDNIVRDLRETFAAREKKAAFEIDDVLPPDVFKELAILTSDYSEHMKTRTVKFSKSDGSCIISKESAFSDSSKDTYIDNGIVATRYFLLLNAITKHAESYKKHPITFDILSVLFNTITHLKGEDCNQQNAIYFATVLLQFDPSRKSKDVGAAAPSWKERFAAAPPHSSTPRR